LDKPIVAKATEFLKKLHAAGYVNQNAFTGDSNPLLGPSAMIANGPWMNQTDIKSKSALPSTGSQNATQ